MLVHPRCQVDGCAKKHQADMEREDAQCEQAREKACVDPRAAQYNAKANPSAGYGSVGADAAGASSVPLRPNPSPGTILASIPFGAPVVYVVPTEWVQRLAALEELTQLQTARLGATCQSFDALKERQARHEANFESKLQQMYEWGVKLEQRFAEIVTRIRQAVSTLSPI